MAMLKLACLPACRAISRWSMAGLLGYGMLAASCVIIPYEPSAEVRHEFEDLLEPELLRLSTGPRQLLEEIGTAIRTADPRIEVADGQSFIDAVSPHGELTVAGLRELAARAAIDAAGIDYMVVVAEPRDEELESRGSMMLTYGAMKSTTASTYWAAIMDLREGRLLKQATATAVGTDRGIGLFYAVFIISKPRAGAQKALVGTLVDDISQARPAGPVQVVILASERIPTAADMAARERAARQRHDFKAWLIEDNPLFSEAVPPTAGEGLVYVYRPFDIVGSAHALHLRNRSRAGEFEVTQLWSGGYFPFRVAAEEQQLWIEANSASVVTLSVEPGGVYYLRARYRDTWRGDDRSILEVIDPARGQNDLRLCKLLPSSGEHIAQTRERAEQGFTQMQLQLAQLYAKGVAYSPTEALHRDEVEAYKWYVIVRDTEGASPRWHKEARAGIEALAARLGPEQIAAGEQLAAEWMASFEIQ